MPQKDPFKAVRQTCEGLEKLIEQEWDRAGPILDRFIKEGEYDREMAFRAEVNRRVDKLRKELQYFRQRMPPHTIEKDGIFYRVPIHL